MRGIVLQEREKVLPSISTDFYFWWGRPKMMARAELRRACQGQGVDMSGLLQVPCPAALPPGARVSHAAMTMQPLATWWQQGAQLCIATAAGTPASARWAKCSWHGAPERLATRQGAPSPHQEACICPHFVHESGGGEGGMCLSISRSAHRNRELTPPPLLPPGEADHGSVPLPTPGPQALPWLGSDSKPRL